MKVLIVGGDSLIGGALAQQARSGGHSVITTTRRADGGGLIFDLSEPEFRIFPVPDVAYLCAALTKFSACRLDPLLARRVNLESPVRLAHSLSAQGCRVVFLSTSAVFSNGKARRGSTETPDGGSIYGLLKAEAEKQILAMGAFCSVLRMSKILHPTSPLILNWIAALKSGATIKCYADMGMSPISLADAVKALIALGQSNESGIFQMSALDDISYLDVARHLARRLGQSETRASVASAAEAGIPEQDIGFFTSLDTSRIEGLLEWKAKTSCETIDCVFQTSLAPAARSVHIPIA